MVYCDTWYLLHGQVAAAITQQADHTSQAQPVEFP